MPKYVTRDGRTAAVTSPERALWYGQCGFWCDDWDKLKLVGPGIPACPHCGVPGFITTAREWDAGAERLDRDEPGYLAFLTAHREKCLRDVPGGLLALWNTQKTAGRDLKTLKLIPDGFTPEG